MMVLLLCLLLTFGAFNSAEESVILKIKNQAGQTIDFLWVNTFSETRDLMVVVPPIRHKTETLLNTYESHTFLARFHNHIPGTEFEFVKGPGDETIAIYFDEISNKLTLKSSPSASHIESTVLSATIQCGDPKSSNYSTCVANSILPDLDKLTASKSRLRKTSNNISYRLRNYTCADSTMPTTQPISNYTYVMQDGSERQYEVNVLFDMDHAKIWAIQDFITDDECDILIKHGRPKLRRATVAAEDGTSIVSENRKANQASYHEHYLGDTDPLYDLQQRILEITNYHGGYNLKPEGQEGFTIIQYNPSDQYSPHCDGSCDNTPHIPTGRIATAVMYCMVPPKGGATSFTKADVFVNPKKGAVTFFSYRGSDGKMDPGYTEHSGCPVLEGEKWITTFWMRDGVSNEEPWSNTCPMMNELKQKENEYLSQQRILTGLEEKIVRLVEVGKNNEVIELLCNHIRLVQENLEELRVEIRELKNQMTSNTKTSNDNNYQYHIVTVFCNILLFLALFILFNLPEKETCDFLARFSNLIEETNCSYGIFNDGSRKLFDSLYWFAISFQFVIIQSLLEPLWTHVIRSIVTLINSSYTNTNVEPCLQNLLKKRKKSGKKSKSE